MSVSVLTLHYRIVVQCTLSFLGPKSSPDVLIRYRTFIIFGEKIHPVRLLNTVCLLNLDFFPHFFLTFPPMLSKFFVFLCQFYQFSPFSLLLKHIHDSWKWKSSNQDYTVCLFHPVRLLKFWYFSTLCVYSVLCVY